MNRLILTHLSEVPQTLVKKINQQYTVHSHKALSLKTIEFQLNEPYNANLKKEIQQLAFQYATDTIFLKETFIKNHIFCLFLYFDYFL